MTSAVRDGADNSPPVKTEIKLKWPRGVVSELVMYRIIYVSDLVAVHCVNDYMQ